MNSLKRLLCLGLALLAFAGGQIAFTPTALAQSNSVTEGLNAVGTQTGLSAADPRVIVVRIINVFLGLLAIIMVSIIIYAGFIWMTAGGDAAQVEKAKAYIRNAIIGLIIILTSWALTTYIINKLLEASGGSGGSAGGSGPGGGGFGGGGGSGFSFQVRSITPSGTVLIRNVDVRFLFTRDIDSTTAGSAIVVLKASDNSPVAGTLQSSGDLVTFTPTATCPSDPTRKCFDADTDYIARVSTSLRSTTGQSLSCGGVARPCEVRFRTGNLVDTTPPVVSLQTPFDGQSVPVDDAVRIMTRATDDSGIGAVESLADATLVGRDAPTGAATATYIANILWNTSGLATGTHALQSRANDIDSNSGQSSMVNVVVRPQYCFNGRRDQDETGVDCGGSSCGACSGGACTTGSQCSSGVCSGGVCVDQPIIQEVTPNDGRPGTFVTINGVNFGSAPGRVTIGGQVATAPAVCTASGVSTWSSRQIIVAVPVGGTSGPVSVSSTSGLSDSTADDRGPRLDDFTVNDVARPGLCAANPSSGLPGAAVNLVGSGLGTVRGRVTMADRDVTSISGWTDSQVGINIPVFEPGRYETRVFSGATSSNSVALTIQERVVTGPPIIDGIEPSTSTIGGYITITGRNFGDRPNRVIFRDAGLNAEGDADISFPAACSVNFWQNTSIVVKVPATLRDGLGASVPVRPGSVQISVVRQSDSQRSSSANFGVISGTPGPGICAVQPVAGPIGTQVQVIGENFGGAAGTVFFKGSASTTRIPGVTGAWTGTQASTTVPVSSYTGAVNLRTPGGALSNGVNFQVRNCNEDANMCGRSEVCCEATGACSVGGVCPAPNLNATFAWQTSSGRIPVNPEVVEQCNMSSIASPSPWGVREGGNNACRNADIMIRFTTHLNSATITPASVLVRKCTGSGSNPCSTAVAVPGALSVFRASDDQDYVRFRPTGQLDASSTFEVILARTIASDTDVRMLENAARCGAGNAYCFRFVTGNAVCEPGSIAVSPNPYTAKETGEKVGYQGAARAANDVCIHINGSLFSWNWRTVDDGGAPDPRAVFDAPIDQEAATATAMGETGRNPVKILTEIMSGRHATGTADLFINFVPPRVVDYGPNCQLACTNAALWVKFNTSMNTTRVTASSIELRRCDNENCRASTPVSLGGVLPRFSADPQDRASRPNSYLLLEPVIRAACTATTVLQENTFYKVVLRRNDFVSQSNNLPLDNTNAPEGFVWIFRVKPGPDARCTAASVEVAPGEKIETLIGSRSFFDANPRSSGDQCNAKGQPLVSDHDYAWSSSDTSVARLVGGGALTLSRNLPNSCTNRCTFAGSTGIAGRTANCGNSIIETSNGNLCRRPDATACRPGDTNCRVYLGPARFGSACTMLQPGSVGSEECDLGAANGPTASCSNQCLINPARRVTESPAGTCGNGVLEAGEQCDVGRICSGGAFDGRVCSADSECGAGTCAVVERFGCSDRCQLEGSGSGFSVCGNGSVGDGEACDDGNTNSGDGCSATCLNEGSSPVTALCGNGAIEPGETCEKVGGVWPARCDQATCLNTGTDTCAAGGVPGANCCGNGVRDAGEDAGCDAGVGRVAPGCTARCLQAGSSIGYTTPSVCGDGVIGIGEQCDVTPGTGPVCGGGSRQLAEITGTRDPLPSETNSIMRSNIQATYDAKNGSGIYGLQCGFTTEQQCINQAGGDRSYGLTTGGCCTKRLSLITSNPTRGETQVCRNALVFGVFDGVIQNSNLEQNVLLAKRESAASCPAGTTLLTDAFQAEPGFWGWLKSLWHRMVAFFTGGPAYAQVWCVGRVSGSIRTEVASSTSGLQTTVYFILDNALEANTQYRLVFRGDNNLSDQTRAGIQSTRGVVMDGDTTIDFTTSNKVCGVNNIQLKDNNLDKPFLFTENPEQHQINAQVTSIENGRVVPIVSVPEYSWAWQPWTSSEERNGILRIASTMSLTTAFSTSTVETFQNKNGTSILTAGVQITRDEVNVPSTTLSVIEGSKPARVIICERPWPSVDSRYRVPAFSDESGSPFLPGAFAAGPFYQFSTLYCLDAGSSSTTDDLPMLTVNATQIGANDRLRGVQRQFLMNFTDPALAGDGIGIRVIDNPLHLSAFSWYTSQGFNGRPQSLLVDGYDAVRDGNTVYVAAANADNNPMAGAVSSSIYLISVNPDAKEPTKNIFDQLLSNWSFNINFNSDSRNACVDSRGSVYSSGGKPVLCDADWQCDKYTTASNPLHCSASKAKLRRDTKRIEDFQNMMSTLETSKASAGQYPKLGEGTFLQSISNSLWPSWSQTLSGQLGTTLPSDPINRFMTCGRCRVGSDLTGPCMTDADCGGAGTCVAQVETDPASRKNGFDPATCWNATSRRYLCPKISDYSNSHIYQYRSVDNGQRYELATELEFTDGTRYRPALQQEVKRCSNTNQSCSVNADCTVYDPSGARVVSTGTCNGTGGRWLYTNVCGNREYGIDDVCGNGIRGSSEVCEVGDSLPTPCSTQNDGVLDGTKVQICSDCRGFVDGPATRCVKNALCGNGRIDRYQCRNAAGTVPGFKYGQACSTPRPDSPECGDPRDASLATGGATVSMSCVALAPAEVCDDGALNGTYGHCNRTCSGVGAYCGDGLLSAGETCDNGIPPRDPTRSANGAYCGAGCNLAQSCSIDCRGPAPRCGDNVIQAGNEQCDGNSNSTDKAICYYPISSVDPSAYRACDTNSDCAAGGVCASDPSAAGMAIPAAYQACRADSVKYCAAPGKVCADRVTSCNTDAECVGHGGSCQDWTRLSCSTDAECGIVNASGVRNGRCVAYPSQHVRTCGGVGTANACQWNTWSTCQAQRFCGDGVKDAGEECDDGNRNDNDACTAQCKRNVCGDGSVNTGTEECDLGTRNGQACSAEYGTTCSRCSTSCRMEASSGPFCGNGVKDVGSGEQCDGTDGVAGVTCRSLGYDYSNSLRCAHPFFGVWINDYGCGGGGGCVGRAGQIACRSFDECEGLGAPETIVRYYAAAPTVGSPNSLIPSTAASICTSAPSEGLSCTLACGFQGCKRCSDTPDPGEAGSISGTVFDAVYSVKAVPNARVTLYSRGVRISETFTNTRGEYTFNNVNTRPECAGYRIVIDSYVDNPNTNLYNEGAYGGYWPFESNTFSAPTNAQFCRVGLENDECKTFLLPRVGVNQTLVVNDWNGSLPNYIDAHLIPPADITVGGTRAHIHWNSPGDVNHLLTPHGNLYCYHSDNEADTSCGSFTVAPQSMKFTRSDWATEGYYSYFAKDWGAYGGGTAQGTYNYLNSMQFKTYIVTQDRVVKVKPPTSSAGIGSCDGRLWFVFQQAAADGRITVQGADQTGSFPCSSATVPNESTNFGTFVPN